MRFSIIIPSHNEERDLLVTVADAYASRPHEIIVVDDCSNVPVESVMGSFPEVKVVRPPEQIGAGPAKRLGAEMATGDTIVLLDSHMRMPIDWLERIEAVVQMYPNSLMCTACRGFTSLTKFTAAGAQFSRQGDTFFLGRRWMKRGPMNEVDTCPCLLGACYIIPRHVWRALNGINHNLHGWGYGEQDLSIRAWMYGYEVRRFNGLMIPHHFSRNLKKGGRMNSWHNQFNALVVSATIFEDGVFEELFQPYISMIAKSKATERFDSSYEDVLVFRKEVQAARRYSDAELLDLCGYRLPTHDEQKQHVHELLEKRAGAVRSKDN